MAAPAVGSGHSPALGAWVVRDNVEPPAYWRYQTLLFGRSAMILGAVYLFEYLFRRHPNILPLICRSLNDTQRRLKVFNIEISGNVRRATTRVISAYLWVLRAAVVVVVCYIWDALIVRTAQFDLSIASSWNSVLLNCATGWNCYALNYPSEIEGLANHTKVSGISHFFRVYYIWDLVEVCDYFLTAEQMGPSVVHDQRHRENSVSCWSIGTTSFTEICGGLGVCFAIAGLIVLGFEWLTALLVRHRSKRPRCNLYTGVKVLMLMFLVSWVFVLVWEALTAISVWTVHLTSLVFPILFWQAASVAQILQAELQLLDDAKAAALASPEVGLALDKIAGSRGHMDEGSFQDMQTGETSRRARYRPRALVARFRRRAPQESN